MKLFIKESVGLIFVYCLQVTLFCLIIYLSGYRDISILFYGVFISLFILVSYLIFYYYRRRRVYQKLTTRVIDLDQLLEHSTNIPIGEAIDQMTHQYYRLFTDQLKRAETDQANHLKFIDRWVHQMKTPLSVIELSAKELDEPESSNIREETERLKKGLNTVLYMARMRTITEDFHIKPVKLENLIQAVNQENKRLYIRSHVYPQLIIKRNDIIVETDEKWLFFILDQLLHNAVKYTDHRSQRIEITVAKIEESAQIAITDFGIGIPKHDIKRIYQAFFTGENGRTFRESTGVGLHLAKEAADYLGHHLEVESTVGVGTTFRLTFPETQTLE